MSSFGGAVSHCLRNLVRFTGRDTRSQFWFYILGLFIAQQLVTAAAMIPLMAIHFDRMQLNANAGGVHPGFPTMFDHVLLFSLFIGVLAIVLVAGAIIRRLHDGGLSGGWALPPLPFLVFSTVQMFRLFGDFAQNGGERNHGLFFSIFVSDALYMLAIGTLVILLIKSSDPGTNRFGPPQLD